MEKPLFEGVINVKARVPHGFQITYADWVQLQRTEMGLTLSFFQLELPFLDSDQEQQAFARDPSVDAHCVVRIALPTVQARRLLSGLQDSFNRGFLGEDKKQ